MTLLQIYSHVSQTKERIVEELKDAAAAFGISLNNAVWDINKTQIDSILQGMMAMDAIGSVRIYDRSNALLSGLNELDSNRAKSALDSAMRYRFNLYAPEDMQKTSPIARVELVSNPETVFDRVKVSILVLIANALIKTLALWIIFFFVCRNMLARPLQAMINAIANLDPDFPQQQPEIEKITNRPDELGYLAKTFTVLIANIRNRIGTIAELNSSLDQKVIERTAQLQARTAQIRSIFAHLNQGIFVINSDGIIAPEYSQFLEEIVQQRDLSGKDFFELVLAKSNLGSEKISIVKNCIQASIRAPLQNFEINRHLLPQDLIISTPFTKQKHLEITWLPMNAGQNDAIDRIMLVIKDVTSLKALQFGYDRHVKEINTAHELARIEQPVIFEYLEKASKEIEEINQLNHAFANYKSDILSKLHTLKGHARLIGLKNFAAKIHSCETKYTSLYLSLHQHGAHLTVSSFEEILSDLRNELATYEGVLKIIASKD